MIVDGPATVAVAQTVVGGDIAVGWVCPCAPTAVDGAPEYDKISIISFISFNFLYLFIFVYPVKQSFAVPESIGYTHPWWQRNRQS